MMILTRGFHRFIGEIFQGAKGAANLNIFEIQTTV
jgi:hypothetical protein